HASKARGLSEDDSGTSAAAGITKSEKVGWPTGFEPATTRSTIWGSNQAELRPTTGRDTLVSVCRSVKLLARLSSGGRMPDHSRKQSSKVNAALRFSYRSLSTDVCVGREHRSV